MVLFSYVFSNGDTHLKNFSAIQSTQGDYVLTPAYDLLCTRVHTPNEADMALTLFKHGFSKTYEAYGFYTYKDFYLFGLQVGIKESRVKKIIHKFTTVHELVNALIGKSFLKAEIKEIYQEYYHERINRLEMGYSRLI